MKVEFNHDEMRQVSKEKLQKIIGELKDIERKLASSIMVKE